MSFAIQMGWEQGHEVDKIKNTLKVELLLNKFLTKNSFIQKMAFRRGSPEMFKQAQLCPTASKQFFCKSGRWTFLDQAKVNVHQNWTLVR